jgi:hypothetical protein
LNSRLCTWLFEVNGMDTLLSFCCHHHHHHCCIFYPLLCVQGYCTSSTPSSSSSIFKYITWKTSFNILHTHHSSTYWNPSCLTSVIYITLDIYYISEQLSGVPKEFKVVIFSLELLCYYKGKVETVDNKVEVINRIRRELLTWHLSFSLYTYW